MRAIAISVWVFINLGFFGMCGYIYLMFSQYWYKAAHQAQIDPYVQKKTVHDPANQIIFYQSQNGDSKSTRVFQNGKSEKTTLKNVVKGKRSHPRNQSSKSRCDTSISNCTSNLSLLSKRINTYKYNLFIQLRRVLHEESSVFKMDNPYNVNYNGPRELYVKKKSEEIKCLLQSIKLRTLAKTDPPFNTLDIGDLIGEERPIFPKKMKSCAIVSNAASLLGSKLGQHIDDHEVVVRFNHAPTEGFEEDVGHKTQVRIVNSQVVSKAKFNFTLSQMYKNITIIAWDPSNYTSSLEQWYLKPDFDLFERWALHKTNNQQSESFILDPRSVWSIWNYIQSLISLRIRRNPPSSGFLGLALMLAYCNYVDVYEYIPSLRQTKRCHYFDSLEDTSCTFGVWHPLAAEKLLSLAMNDANDTSVFSTGFIRISGFDQTQC